MDLKLKRLKTHISVLVGLIWLLICLWPKYTLQKDTLDLWMLNVGQGESVLLREPTGLKILFDGGPDDSVLPQLGAVLQPLDRKIDLMILSHNHSDHLRGLILVLQRYQVKKVWISGAIQKTADFQAFKFELSKQEIPTEIKFFDLKKSKVPQTIIFGQLKLSVLYPLRNMTNEFPPNQHDADLVVKVNFGPENILLTGDLNEEHENEILAACKIPDCSLQADVLQVPHHGSKTGLIFDFLNNIAPQIALIPVGIDNNFGHPDPTTINKLKKFGVQIFRTDLQARIHLTINQKKIAVQLES